VNRPGPPVAITGLGLLTPAGRGVDCTWERILTGRSAATVDPDLGDAPWAMSCRVSGFNARTELGGGRAWRLDRFAQLAIAAARDAVTDADLDTSTWDGARVAVVLGNSLGGSATFETQQHVHAYEGADMVSPLLVPMWMPNMVAGYVAIELGARGPSMVTATACASGTTAIGTGRDLLRSGACDIAIVGGSESALSPTVMAGLAKMGALSNRGEDAGSASRPFEIERDGFVAAEAAGILVLERESDAVARAVRRYASIVGYAATSDAYHATAPRPDGASLKAAIRGALDDAGIAECDIGHVNAHGTSTPLNDRTESAALYEVFGERAAVTSTKGVTGHPLAAAGAIEAAFTALAIRDQIVPPTANLNCQDPDVRIDIVSKFARTTPMDAAISVSAGFGGHNAALVLTAV